MSDYSRGVEAASAIYQETINEYVKENEKLRELVRHMWGWMTSPSVSGAALHDISGQMRELGVEVQP